MQSKVMQSRKRLYEAIKAKQSEAKQSKVKQSRMI